MGLSIYREIDDEVFIDGKRYKINASFDRILKAIELSNDAFPGDVKIKTTAILLFGDQLAEFDVFEQKEILDIVLPEYLDSKREVEFDDLGNVVPRPAQAEEEDKLLDINHDADAIFASFMQAYGINLQEEIGKLHWYEFKALLAGLPEKTRMREIISIRGYRKPNANESYHTQMMKLKEQYKLPTEDEEVDEY